MDDPRKHAYVLAEIKGIPMQLWNILCPRTFKGFALYLKNIAKWLIRSKERSKVIQLQKQYGLPLRPNQSLNEVKTRINIIQLKKRRGYKNDDSDKS